MTDIGRTAAVTTQLNERQEGNLDAPKAAKPLSTSPSLVPELMTLRIKCAATIYTEHGREAAAIRR